MPARGKRAVGIWEGEEEHKGEDGAQCADCQTAKDGRHGGRNCAEQCHGELVYESGGEAEPVDDAERQ